MLERSCFVIMPIGDQAYDDVRITGSELKARYTDLIKEALLAARPDLDVVRSDEVVTPGGITSDVFTRLMHSDYVIADITFPNPNVFYELGIRHACRYGTLLIKAADGPHAPFDIAGERHIPYHNTPTGLKTLASELSKKFDWFDANPGKPDNEFQKLAHLTHYQFPVYRKKDPNFEQNMVEAAVAVLTDPESRALLMAQASGEKPTPEAKAALMEKLLDKPDSLRKLILALLQSGKLTF